LQAGNSGHHSRIIRYEATITENLHREDLSPLEEAEGIQGLLNLGWNDKQVANQLGKRAKWV